MKHTHDVIFELAPDTRGCTLEHDAHFKESYGIKRCICWPIASRDASLYCLLIIINISEPRGERKQTNEAYCLVILRVWPTVLMAATSGKFLVSYIKLEYLNI